MKWKAFFNRIGNHKKRR